MRSQKIMLLAVVLLTFLHYGYAQQLSVPPGYMEISSNFHGGVLSKEYHPSGVTMKIPAGFISIQPNAHFKRMANRLYYRGYFSKSGIKKSLNLGLFTHFEDRQPIYMKPGQEFTVDILTRTGDSLLYKYTINRPVLIPEVILYTQKDGKPLAITEKLSIGEVDLPPGGSVRLGIDHKLTFLEARATLINLKTRKRQEGFIRNGLLPLNLHADTDYELRVSFTQQPEIQSVIIIHVKPFWFHNWITSSISTLVLSLFVLWMVATRLRRKVRLARERQVKLEEAAVRLQSQLNPHFTFNALSSIQGLMNTGRIDEANYYLQEFSSLLRKTLSKSQHVYNTLDQELEMMRTYIRLEALRFNFSWEIEVDETLSTAEIEIPTLLLQPLIENAIKHGLVNLAEKGQLHIFCKQGETTDTLVIAIQDNGEWLDQPQGYGLSLTADRISAINKIRKDQQISLTFDKSSGTSAILHFKNLINN